MPAKFGAGQLKELIAFDTRAVVDDGYGNEVAGDWAEQFRKRAEFVFLRGSETVMAGRLQSNEIIVVRTWLNDQTRQVSTDWQMRDVRRGDAYNITSIQEKHDGVIDFLCQSNVATG